jgi:hypothetical protein
MKSIKFKHTPLSGGRLSPQNPFAKTGLQNGVYTYEILNVPDDTPTERVMQLAEHTVFLSAKFDGSGRYTYDYQELGVGKIIRS